MAKDPAFLFYPGDWMGGTQWLTMEQKGCYIELLILQFNTGGFTVAQAKQVLSICFDVAWPVLEQKFILADGKYYNERLKGEIEKRKKFTDSRRDNALGVNKKEEKKTGQAKHMLQHMEDEDEDVIKDKDILLLNKIVIEERFFEIFLKWLKYKRSRSESYKNKESVQLAYNKLIKLSGNDFNKAIMIVENSMANNWAGLFEIKTSDIPVINGSMITVKTEMVY